ncbi:hypothetical protein AVEN_245475-1 [Araneus ventricosus]|uniref:Uncharacterized protein n=1 Tax=Araneus ventricosus TaxID=182803 RepID=A0A4Y2D920_ARAVE|nr:hypothetical protein AVEN_245475-1 [Araneus ventricosus]
MQHEGYFVTAVIIFEPQLDDMGGTSSATPSLNFRTISACFDSHGKSLPSNASLMVGKRVLQGEAWSDLRDSYGTHDLGDKLGDHFGDKFGDLGDK